MCEYYEDHNRWEPLAEFHFNIDENEELYENDNYVYCLCSRVCIKDGVRYYYAEKERVSESDPEMLLESHSQELEDQSHVHFSVDASDRVKFEKDEAASCYCSASHTDNYCSTDEHEPAQVHSTNALQPSDSGADLTYQDCQSDYILQDKQEKMDQDSPLVEVSNENYLSEPNWEKFWSVNGERLIWASWIKKYSDYINPAYLDENSDLIMDEGNMTKENSVNEIFTKENDKNTNSREECMRERKFSFDSKINPYKKTKNIHSSEKAEKTSDTNKDDVWVQIPRRRSCSEHDRMLSPRTITCTDSMTNVTKLTISSYDATSSHVTSESSPTDECSVSSGTSEDPSNDQTRIVNVEENHDQMPSDVDTENYWQFLWKKHFGEQYALHYANYIECKNVKASAQNLESIKEDKIEGKILDVDCENSDGNSQEMPSVIEVQTKVDNISIDDKTIKTKRKTKRNNSRYLNSVGVLLQNLFKDENLRNVDYEQADGTEGHNEKTKEVAADVVDSSVKVHAENSESNININSDSYNDGNDDPPDEKAMILKRSHELDYEEVAAEKIKSTFDIMGFCVGSEGMPKGTMVYRKRMSRLRPPGYRRFGASRKTYFDDDGNPYQLEETNEWQDENGMQTDEEYPQVKSESENAAECGTVMNYDVPNREDAAGEEEFEAADVALPADRDHAAGDGLDADVEGTVIEDNAPAASEPGTAKRKRRTKRNPRQSVVDPAMPAELRDDPKMKKYWKKRHSLFHRFDEGVRLDRESWFSVTPERVARHVAAKCRAHSALDAFCGAGGNTIQLARHCQRVIAIDIDPVKIELAKHNATIYNVADKIEFIVGDFFQLAPTLKADMVFLSPPWGGPEYSESQEYDLETMLEPRPASELMEVARTISPTIALYLPRNSKTEQIVNLAKDSETGSVEIEQNFLDRRFVAIVAYFY